MTVSGRSGATTLIQAGQGLSYWEEPTAQRLDHKCEFLVCNIYDATLKIIAVAKVKANIVIHICSSIALAGGSANGLSATGAWAILVSLDGAAADDSSSVRLILKTSETFVRHWSVVSEPGLAYLAVPRPYLALRRFGRYPLRQR